MTFANPVRFLDSKGELLHSESLSLMSSPAGRSGKTLRKGVGYLDSGVLVNEPMDFSHKNVFPLHEQHLLVREVYFPGEEGLRLTPADREFVKTTMGQFPRECAATTDAAIREEPDTYVKNFLGWAKQPIRDTLRCYNKSGQAYGYMIDNAYIVDEDHDIAFFLSTAIHMASALDGEDSSHHNRLYLQQIAFGDKGWAASLHFTSLHSTSLHFTSLHFPSLHFTSLHFTSLHFTSLHFTSRHVTSRHFTGLLGRFRHATPGVLPKPRVRRLVQRRHQARCERST